MNFTSTFHTTMGEVREKRREVLDLIDGLKNETPDSYSWKRILIKLSKDYYDIDGMIKHLTLKETDFILESSREQARQAERMMNRLRRRRRAGRLTHSDIEEEVMANIIDDQANDTRAIFDEHSLNQVSNEEIEQDPNWYIPLDDEEYPPEPVQENIDGEDVAFNPLDDEEFPPEYVQENMDGGDFSLNAIEWPSL